MYKYSQLHFVKAGKEIALGLSQNECVYCLLFLSAEQTLGGKEMKRV